MRIRQSGLGSADDCLRKFQYSQDLPDFYGAGSVRAVGTGYHAGLEILYRSRTESGWHDDLTGLTTFRPDLELPLLVAHGIEAFDYEVFKGGDNFIWDRDKVPDREFAIELIRSMLTTFWEGGYEWPEDWEVLGVEHTFSLVWNGHDRTGTIDLVLRDPNGWIVAEDHKTAGKMWPAGKEHPRKNNQAPWYLPMLEDAWPGANGYRFVFGVMTYKGKFERRISDPQPRHVAAVEAKALQIVTLYEGMKSAGMDLPANPSSTLCNPKYCDFFSICPHGSVLE